MLIKGKPSCLRTVLSDQKSFPYVEGSSNFHLQQNVCVCVCACVRVRACVCVMTQIFFGYELV